MLSVSTLIDKLNTLIVSGSLTELQLLQAFGAVDSLEQKGVVTVYYETDLPAASLNKGRFVYITSTGKYTFSNGTTWNINNILVKFDINAYAWGNNSLGQLGDNTIVSRSSPVSVLGGFTDWIQIADLGFGNVGIRANGTAWAWGYGGFGNLGDNTAVTRSSPVSVVGGFTDWVQVSAGNDFALGLRANGTAWAWGNGGAGRLGDGTAAIRSSPVSVVGGFTDWIQLSAAAFHSMGIRANGTAWAWGTNSFGRLGDNTSVSKSSPVSIVGGFTDWIQLSGGGNHALGIRANGTAWAWGRNSNGQLGNNAGLTLSISSPVSVVGGFTDWIQVSGGYTHSLGLRANGTAWAWGYNGVGIGRLGDNTTTTRSSPVSVVGGFTDWAQLSGGKYHSLGLRTNGTAWAWGTNTAGRLGDNSVLNRSSPVSIVGGFTNWIQVSSGPTAIHSTGILR
jgi:alpha-tubulin suppressor-like RCC1 family protein